MKARGRWAPTRNISVNNQHPLSIGLQFAAGACSGWNDIVQGNRPTSNVTCSPISSSLGRAALANSSNYVSYPSRAAGTYLDFTTQPFTVLWVASLPALSGGVYPLGPSMSIYTSESVNKGWLVARRDNADGAAGATLQVFSNVGFAVYAADAGSASDGITANIPFVFVGVSSGASSQKVFINGILRGSSSSPNPVSVGASTPLTIGQNQDSYNIFNAIWNRALTDIEIQLVSSQPYCFLKGR